MKTRKSKVESKIDENNEKIFPNDCNSQKANVHDFKKEEKPVAQKVPFKNKNEKNSKSI